MRRGWSFIAGLGGERRGVSVIELALAMPLIVMMMVGLIDVASFASAKLSLQQAAARSLERAQVSDATSNFDHVAAEAALAAEVDASQVAVTSWLECNGVKQAASVTLCPAGQTTAKYVQVAITSSYTPWFPYSPVGTRGSDGKVAMSVSSAVRYG